MTSQRDKAAAFLAAHTKGAPLLMPNPWDVGSAGLLAHLGFRALATTSSGFAASLGRLDYGIARDEAVAHAAAIVAATELPVSADFENGFADDPTGVVETIDLAIAAGLAGCSIEDSTGRTDDPIYDIDLAVERVAAAAEAAHRGDVHLVLTARAENRLHGRKDLADTIRRVQRFQEVGADVVFAPGIRQADELRSLVASVDVPVSVLAMPGVPVVAELAEMGVARVSVGGAFAYAAYGAMVTAARELLDSGTYGYWETTGIGSTAVRAAFD